VGVFLNTVCTLCSAGANDEYTHHSVHVTQPYIGYVADHLLAPG